jgi:hypothetical protein
VTGRQGRRNRQLLDDSKKTRKYCKLNEVLYRTLWRNGFERGSAPGKGRIDSVDAITFVLNSLAGEYGIF